MLPQAQDCKSLLASGGAVGEIGFYMQIQGIQIVLGSNMKIVIISDIHGNFDALSHLPEAYDELWVLGDLVNYGPEPAEVISFIRKRTTCVVRGNHDHCVGFGEDPRCAAGFREMAEATRRYTESVLSEDDRNYLRSLPLYADVWVGKTRCRLCHTVPSDPPFTHYPSRSEQWEEECRRAGANILLVGHGHVPFGRWIGNTLLANPGSLGQPKSGEPVASYAVLKDGKLGFRSFHYPVNLTAGKVRAMPIPAPIRSDLITVLRTGSVPQGRSQNVFVGHFGG
jgi:protein phosphatase